MVRGTRKFSVTFLALGFFASIATTVAIAAPKGTGAGDPGVSVGRKKRPKSKKIKASTSPLSESVGHLPLGAVSGPALPTAVPPFGESATIVSAPTECSVELSVVHILSDAEMEVPYATYLKTELEKIAKKKKIAVENVSLEDLTTDDLARFQLMQQFFARRVQPLSKRPETIAQLSCMNLPMGMSASIQAVDYLAPLVEFENIVSRVKAHLPKSPTATDLKIALEKVLSDRARASGTRLRYNREFSNVFDALQAHRIQCSSATQLFLQIDRRIRGDRKAEGSPLVIFSPGHVQSGFASWTEGFNSWDPEIQVMEQTATDGALLSLGKASKQEPGERKFLLERDYFIGQSLKDYLRSSTTTKPSGCLENSSLTEIGAGHLVGQRVAARTASGRARRQGDGIGSAFGFGDSHQESGDFSRGATLRNRNGGLAGDLNLRGGISGGRSSSSFFDDGEELPSDLELTSQRKDPDEPKYQATLDEESTILIELGNDAEKIGMKPQYSLKTIFEKYRMIPSSKDQEDEGQGVRPQRPVSAQRMPESLDDLKGMQVLGKTIAALEAEFKEFEAKRSDMQKGSPGRSVEEKPEINSPIPLSVGNVPEPKRDPRWTSVAQATSAQAAGFERFIRENPRALAVLMDVTEPGNELLFEVGKDGKLKAVKLVVYDGIQEVPAEFLAELSSDWSDWVTRSGMQLASQKNDVSKNMVFARNQEQFRDPKLRDDIQNFVDDIDVSTPLAADLTYTAFKKFVESQGGKVRIELKGKTTQERQKERYEILKSNFDPATWQKHLGSGLATRYEYMRFAGAAPDKELVLKLDPTFEGHATTESELTGKSDGYANTYGSGFGSKEVDPSSERPVRRSTQVDDYLSSVVDEQDWGRHDKFSDALKRWNFKKIAGVHLQFEPGIEELRRLDSEPNESKEPMVSIAEIKRQINLESPRVQEWLKQNPNAWAEVFRIDIDAKLDQPYWDKLTGILVVPQKSKFWFPPRSGQGKDSNGSSGPQAEIDSPSMIRISPTGTPEPQTSKPGTE